jgi:hypothetical protein
MIIPWKYCNIDVHMDTDVLRYVTIARFLKSHCVLRMSINFFPLISEQKMPYLLIIVKVGHSI